MDPRRMERPAADAGMAVVSALLVMILMAGIAAGLMALVVTDARVRMLDGTRLQAFYTAHAGLEKLTADLGDLFSANVAPSGAQITAIGNAPPNLPGVTWLEPDGADGYVVAFPADPSGNPIASVTTVMSGPFQGLVGLATPYEMRSTARLPDLSEATLTRTLQTIAIPVFQFGIFSENDLSYFAGPDFNFGGRIHTNQNLYLAAGSQLTLADRVTAVGEVIRTNLSNGWDTNSGYTGNVRVSTAPNVYRNLARTEGSLVAAPGSALNEPLWTNLSTGTYNSNITNGRTGARRLDLPVTTLGAQPIDLLKRALPNEDTTNPQVLGERFFSLASLRILLSDTTNDILSLPTVTSTPPVDLGNQEGTQVVEPPWYAVTTERPNFAESPGPQQNGDNSTSQRYGSRSAAGTPLLGGFIKIEVQTTPGTWQDVTQEILNLGIAGAQLPNPGTGSPNNCQEPSPDAIVRLQRFRDRDNGCWHTQSQTNRKNGRNFSPLVLYDTREGVVRDGTSDNAPMQFGGIVHYIELDAGNLSRWFAGQIGVSGPSALDVNGYTVYFSDRRGNRDTAGHETGEYGFEDVINPFSSSGWPNGVLDPGEDFNGNGQLDTYGMLPQVPGGMQAPFVATARPWSGIDPAGNLSSAERQAIAARNPAVFFRRALKLVNGQNGLPYGLTIASENPVYLQGNWNANSNSFPANHSATAILADALTLLSNSWNDRESLQDPHNQSPRNASQTSYRFAVIAGKGLSFPHVSGTYQDFGTDGGAHNFLRFLENWGGVQLNFRGSIASFFYSRQGVGSYKCCSDVYSPPSRGYNFDTDFLVPALLPPRTPMFRDVNTTGFAQIIRPR